jgi:hypothetical protein
MNINGVTLSMQIASHWAETRLIKTVNNVQPLFLFFFFFFSFPQRLRN